MRYGKRFAKAFVVVAALLAAGAAQGAPRANAEDRGNAACDRGCLLAHLNTILEAIGRNSPERVKLASDAKTTANGAKSPIDGANVWGPARRIPYRLTFSDPQTGSAIFFGVVTNSHQPPKQAAGIQTSIPPGAGNSWWFYALRIKVADGKITEVEQVDYEPSQGFGEAEVRDMKLAERLWDTVLPRDAQSSRADLIKIADSYFDVISNRVDTIAVPWHPACQRVESGVHTTDSDLLPLSCAAGMDVPSFTWNVQNRRFYIVDVEHGVVVAAANFMIPKDAPPGSISGILMEAFKIENGLIRHIDAFSRVRPHQQKTGWGDGPGS